MSEILSLRDWFRDDPFAASAAAASERGAGGASNNPRGGIDDHPCRRPPDTAGEFIDDSDARLLTIGTRKAPVAGVAEDTGPQIEIAARRPLYDWLGR
jgi:hypothetical protein